MEGKTFEEEFARASAGSARSRESRGQGGEDAFAMSPARGARTRAQRAPGVADACPGVLRLHEAADGTLARVRAPGGRLDARALAALAEAAALGSGIVELTSRAGLQVRGLSDGDAEEIARVLAGGGLLPSITHERVRNILAPPLAGRDPAALAPVDALVDSLDRALCADAALAELPGRFLFAVDDGTRALHSLRADVELAAERDAPWTAGAAWPAGAARTAGAAWAGAVRTAGAARPVFRLLLDGLATSLVVAPADAPGAALDAARAFLALREEDGEGAWRVRELRGGAVRVAERLDLTVDAGRASASDPRRRLGLRLQRDGLLAVAALPPLARLDRTQLLGLAELCRAQGVDVRVSPWRTLTLVDVPACAAVGVLGALRDIGLVTGDQSGWVGLSACAGLGACARALVDVRAAAGARARERDETSPTEHWSGCERRCGEPPDAGVSVVACERGLVVSAGDAAGAEAERRTVATAAAALELLERAGARA